MDWSLVGLWMIQLFAVKEQIQVDRPPEGSSVSLSLTIIQNAMQMWNEEADSHRALSIQLSDAVKDNYERRSRKQAHATVPREKTSRQQLAQNSSRQNRNKNKHTKCSRKHHESP